MPTELIAPAREEVAFREYESPPLRPDQIRVRSRFGAAKHGSEMAMFQGYAGHRGNYDGELHIFTQESQMVKYPNGLGNMCVGEATEIGKEVQDISLGDTVFAHGSFRQEHVWPAQHARRLPDGVPWQAAVCLDPADFALGAVRDGHIRLGDTVAVFGMGAIGLFVVQLAKLAGAYPVIAVDPISLRRDVAEECGADIVMDPTSCDAGLEIKLATDRRGADVCVDYSGHYSALQAALRGVAYLGTVVAGAWPGSYPAGLDLGAEAHFNRPTIVFSRACSEPNPEYPNWDENRLFSVVWRLLCDGSLKAEPVVQPVVPFEDLLDEYPKIANAPEENVKLGVAF
ncbi:MAG: zinc-binding alcohol dehydrogenase [Caldilineaceae bacterium SB0668_bin_21]|nr:zinc-binding alcohol dehydrogenase [Caldilineaceae bacterium SB0668_bin_21]MYC24102.1 zinc-binding alcohol dehydrogenase [Caldilineaceae bacterium SB0662_bin_25]